jgi:putative ABC transport system permease protein
VPGPRPFREIIRLAYRDAGHEQRITLCLTLALLAVLAPLLVLFGLKFGLVDTLAQRLIQLPSNREIIGVGSGYYDADWFRTMDARSDVEFVIPNTRRIAASLTTLRHPMTAKEAHGVQMLPTGPGDPLLAPISAPTRIDQVVLAGLTARKLGAVVGDRLRARIDRRRNDRAESVALDLTVVGIAADSALPLDGVFVPLELLTATEDYRDGFTVERFQWPGKPPVGGERPFARFRLYARSIYDVASLQDRLIESGVEVRTNAAEIESMQALDRNLSRVFWLLAALGSGGFVASLAANLLANVDRKQRELSILRLLGFPTRALVLFPVIQAGLIGAGGAIAALLAYWLVAEMLNGWFAASLQPRELICQLLPGHVLVALGATLLCAVVASAWAGYRAARIDPAEGIRDV